MKKEKKSTNQVINSHNKYGEKALKCECVNKKRFNFFVERHFFIDIQEMSTLSWVTG